MTAAARVARPLLLVEDNPGDATYIQELLADAPSSTASVVHVERLSDAIVMLQNEAFGAVLLDLRLPDAVGVDCVKAIRAIADDVPIVVLTGVDDDELALSCIDAGAQDYLAKQDVRTQTLRRSIAYAIARSREKLERLRADRLQERMAAIFEASSDAIITATAEGVVTSWNRGAEAILGHTKEAAVGRSIRELLPAPSSEGPTVGELIFLETNEAVTAIDWDSPDRGAIALSVAVCNLRDSQGHLVALAAICRDTTETRRQDRELRQNNADLKARDLQMRALTGRLNVVREEERTRISRVVHDELGQLLTAIKMDLRWITKRVQPTAPVPVEAIVDKLGEAEELADLTIETVQRVAVELRPSALDALGLPAALRDEARRFADRSGIATIVEVEDTSRPRPDVATHLFRIFQELLTNVARHARAQRVWVRLDVRDQQWLLQVRDDGIGIQIEEGQTSSSLGLLGISERAASLGGTLELARASAGGTVATVRVARDEVRTDS